MARPAINGGTPAVPEGLDCILDAVRKLRANIDELTALKETPPH